MTTPNHPFYSDRHGGFVEAAELIVGDTLRLSNGQTATLTDLHDERAIPGETFTTYNFAVAEHHTYFVGRSAVWVHNTGNLCDTLTDKFLDLKKQNPDLSNAELFKQLKEAAPELASGNYSDTQIRKHLDDAAAKLKAGGYSVDPDSNTLPAHQAATRAKLLDEHKGLNVKVANESLHGTTGANGAGVEGGDLPLVAGGTREVSVHHGSLSTLQSHLRTEGNQAGVKEIFLQINTPGATQQSILNIFLGPNGLRNGMLELKGKRVRIFGPNGEQWFDGVFTFGGQ